MGKVEKRKRRYTREKIIDFLVAKRVKFHNFDDQGIHLRIGEYDLWPSTERYVHRRKRQWGIGFKDFWARIGKNSADLVDF